MSTSNHCKLRVRNMSFTLFKTILSKVEVLFSSNIALWPSTGMMISHPPARIRRHHLVHLIANDKN
jgi:hypothetical protein